MSRRYPAPVIHRAPRLVSMYRAIEHGLPSIATDRGDSGLPHSSCTGSADLAAAELHGQCHVVVAPSRSPGPGLVRRRRSPEPSAGRSSSSRSSSRQPSGRHRPRDAGERGNRMVLAPPATPCTPATPVVGRRRRRPRHRPRHQCLRIRTPPTPTPPAPARNAIEPARRDRSRRRLRRPHRPPSSRPASCAGHAGRAATTSGSFRSTRQGDLESSSPDYAAPGSSRAVACRR